MRIVLAFFALIVCVLISQTKIKKYYLRVLFFSDFINFNNKMINQVNFEKKTL